MPARNPWIFHPHDANCSCGAYGAANPNVAPYSDGCPRVRPRSDLVVVGAALSTSDDVARLGRAFQSYVAEGGTGTMSARFVTWATATKPAAAVAIEPADLDVGELVDGISDQVERIVHEATPVAADVIYMPARADIDTLTSHALDRVETALGDRLDRSEIAVNELMATVSDVLGSLPDLVASAVETAIEAMPVASSPTDSAANELSPGLANQLLTQLDSVVEAAVEHTVRQRVHP